MAISGIFFLRKILQDMALDLLDRAMRPHMREPVEVLGHEVVMHDQVKAHLLLSHVALGPFPKIWMVLAVGGIARLASCSTNVCVAGIRVSLQCT